jgi:hypothetical protein
LTAAARFPNGIDLRFRELGIPTDEPIVSLMFILSRRAAMCLKKESKARPPWNPPALPYRLAVGGSYVIREFKHPVGDIRFTDERWRGKFIRLK